MSSLVILKWQLFECMAKFEKKSLLFRSEIGIVTCFLKDCMKKVLKIYKSIVIKNFKLVPLCPIKWRSFKVVEKLHKRSLSIANIVKGAVSDLRPFLATENPLKLKKNLFHSFLKAFFVLKIVKLLSRPFSHVEKIKIRLEYKDKANIKIYDATTLFTNNYNTHIAQYLTK